MRVYERVIALTVVALLAVPAASAAGDASDARSVLVQPIRDGDCDAESESLGLMIADAMGVTTRHRIIDPIRAFDALAYYDESKSPDGDFHEAKRSMATAKEHYFQFRYDEAAAELERAVSILEERRDKIGEMGGILQNAYLSLAVVSKSRGKLNEARGALSSALRLNPSLSLSEREYPPSFMELFRQTRNQAVDGQGGAIDVSTKPPVAEIYLNGVFQGISPLTLEGLPSGAYHISLKANRYRSIDKDVNVSGGEVVRIRERLKWISKRSQKNSEAKADAEREIGLALQMADTMKAEKVILVDVDSAGGDSTVARARMVDRKFRAGQRPVVLPRGIFEDDSTEAIADMVRYLAAQVEVDLTKNPARDIDPLGVGDPVLLGNRRKPVVKNPIFWGAIGAAAAAAIAGGVAASVSGGSSDNKGDVMVRFK